MKISNITVKNPITTIMIFLGVLLFGVFSMQSLPKDLFPDAELPALTVITIYPGATAEDVEIQVTDNLEKVLSGTENLKKITSVSKENVSIISLQFDWGTDVSDAANSARDIMELVKKNLPSGAMNPYIMKVNSAMIPVVVYAIQADESYNGLERITYDQIIEPLKKVKGVGTAFVIAQPSREISIQVDPAKLDAYNLSIPVIANVLKAENVSIPGGNVKFGKYDFSVRIPGEIESIEQLEQIPIIGFQNKIVRLKDVATVVDDYKEKDEIVYSNGSKGIALFIQKQSGSNTFEVYKDITSQMDEITKTLPPDIKVDIVFDTSEIIEEVTNNLNSTIWYAILFVTIIVFAFLREWRNSLIVVLTIPFSMMTAYITMKLAGYTINTFSLMSLIVAIGMVVDNAIVVLENVNRHIGLGEKPIQAAVNGSSEMGNAILASTLTTISVFIPLIFVGGIVGILFKQLAILVSVTMLASLITALTLTPVLSSLMLKEKGQKKKHKNMLFRLSEKMFVSFESAYSSVLKFSLKHKFSILIVAIVAFLITMFCASRMGTDYIPEIDAGDVITTIEVEVGTNVHETERIAKMVEAIYVEEIPEMVSQYTIIGQTESNLLSSVGFKEGKNKATISAHLCLPQDRDRSAQEIAAMLTDRLSEIPEIESFKVTGGSMMQNVLLGNNKPIEIRITGRDFEKINNTALEVVELMEQEAGFVDIESTIDRGKIEYQIIIDKNKASALGLNTSIIGLQVRQSLYGADAGDYTENGTQYDMFIKYDKKDREDIDDIENILITNLVGIQVPLSSFSEVTEGYGPFEIKHESQSRIVTVGANLNDIPLSDGAKIAQNIIDNLDKDSSIQVSVGGKTLDQEESFGNLKSIFIISILLVYMIMASQFESLKDPFIIIFAIPFSLIGVVLAFFVMGINLNIVTFVGVIMLMGIVVNNGIVLVDYANQLRQKGQSVYDAIIESGRSRLRPVLMTTLTTILAMIPMVVSDSIGRELWSPLGITLIGGLLVSTLITLVLVPCLYAILNHKKFRKGI